MLLHVVGNGDWLVKPAQRALLAQKDAAAERVRLCTARLPPPIAPGRHVVPVLAAMLAGKQSSSRHRQATPEKTRVKKDWTMFETKKADALIMTFAISIAIALATTFSIALTTFRLP